MGYCAKFVMLYSQLDLIFFSQFVSIFVCITNRRQWTNKYDKTNLSALKLLSLKVTVRGDADAEVLFPTFLSRRRRLR